MTRDPSHAGHGNARLRTSATRIEAPKQFVENVRQQFEMPGVAIGIVQGGKVVFADGFGVHSAPAGLQDNPITAGLVGTLRWGPVAMLGWGALRTVHAFYRIGQC